MSEAKIGEHGAEENQLRALVQDVESQIEEVSSALQALRLRVSRLSGAVAAFDTAPAAYGTREDSAPAADAPDSGPGRPFEAPPGWSSGTIPATADGRAVSTAGDTPRTYGASAWDSTADGASWPVSPKAESWDFSLPNESKSAEAEAPTSEAHASEPPAVMGDDIAFELAGVSPEAEVAANDLSSTEVSTPEIGVDSFGAKGGQPGEPGVEAKAGTKSKSLSAGWADASSWSQGFEWPAMQKNEAKAPAPVDDNQTDVSAIVAQVRAEMEAAQLEGKSIFLEDDTAMADADDAEAKTTENTEAGVPEEGNDEARRAEVSRMVEAMRAEFAAPKRSGFDDIDERTVFGSQDQDEDGSAFVDANAGHAGAGTVPTGKGLQIGDNEQHGPSPASDGSTGEAAGVRPNPSEPAQAPSFADWSLQADAGGPPSLVVKDAEGRVQLADVYELLNRLGCGDSAALLNYTPHSVTVGLPLKAAMPGEEKLAAAVLAVFSRKCSVSTDGVRISVEIGTDPKKRRNEDAA